MRHRTTDNYEVVSFFDTLLHKDTLFTVKKVYQYDTFPGWAILDAEVNFHDENDFSEEWMVQFDTRFTEFKQALENTLQLKGLLENKIGVVLEYVIPGFRDGMRGTLIWCHKDWHNGFFFGCNPNKYVKDNLNIEFHV